MVSNATKYPRTYHTPGSQGAARDDRRIPSLRGLVGVPLVLTEKLDGSNVALRADASHPYARSHGGAPSHPSFAPLKALHAALRPLLPPNATVYGEWLYAVHTLVYERLPEDPLQSLYLFAIRNDESEDYEGYWRSWDAVESLASDLGVDTVPVLERFKAYGEREIEREAASLATGGSSLGGRREGVVLRQSGGFPESRFSEKVAKYVAEDFTVCGEHWSRSGVLRHIDAVRARNKS